VTRVSVDLSGIAALREQAEREFSARGILQRMRPHVDGAALGERSTHLYRNRTGRLEYSTRSVVDVATRQEVRITLMMTMPYAEFVWRLGYSDIDGFAAQSHTAILEDFGSQAKTFLR
jgi:hypothetical protein